MRDFRFELAACASSIIKLRLVHPKVGTLIRDGRSSRWAAPRNSQSSGDKAMDTKQARRSHFAWRHCRHSRHRACCSIWCRRAHQYRRGAPMSWRRWATTQLPTHDVRTQMSRIEQNGPFPRRCSRSTPSRSLNQLVFEKELAIEAQQLGISVTDQERADRIRQLIPTAFVGDTFVGMDQYAAQVQQRAGMSVPGIRRPGQPGPDRGEIPAAW